MKYLSLFLVAVFSLPGAAQMSKSTAQTSFRISGMVRMGNGVAPQGVQVVVESRSAGGIAGQANTDNSGQFSFTNIGSGVYTVSAHYPGYTTASEVVDTRTNSTAFVTLTLKPQEGTIPLPESGSAAGVPPDAQKEFEAGNKLLNDKKDLKGSVAHFKKATELYPAYAPAYFMLGTVYMDQQKWKEGQASLEKAISINESFAGAYLALGSCLAQQGKWADAEKPLVKGLELKADSAMGHYDLGRAYWALNRRPEADPHAVKAVELDPSFAPAHVLMGNVLLQRRENRAALGEFKKYLELDPKGPLAEGTKQIVEKIEKVLAGAKQP